MTCPHCGSGETSQPRRTALGYRTFACRACRRVCNERTPPACTQSTNQDRPHFALWNLTTLRQP